MNLVFLYSIFSDGKSATRVYASTMGILVGLAGVQHGIEVLQGNERPEFGDDLCHRSRHRGSGIWNRDALTVFPSFLFTGILAIIIGFLVTVWAFKYVDGKLEGPVLCRSPSCYLAGGFAPIFMAIPGKHRRDEDQQASGVVACSPSICRSNEAMAFLDHRLLDRRRDSGFR